jgi:ferrochelatase
MSTCDATRQTAIVLFNLGGPENLASVEPFLVNLFSDREIIDLPFGATLQPVLARLIARMRGRRAAGCCRSTWACQPSSCVRQ